MRGAYLYALATSTLFFTLLPDVTASEREPPVLLHHPYLGCPVVHSWFQAQECRGDFWGEGDAVWKGETHTIVAVKGEGGAVFQCCQTEHYSFESASCRSVVEEISQGVTCIAADYYCPSLSLAYGPCKGEYEPSGNGTWHKDSFTLHVEGRAANGMLRLICEENGHVVTAPQQFSCGNSHLPEPLHPGSNVIDGESVYLVTGSLLIDVEKIFAFTLYPVPKDTWLRVWVNQPRLLPPQSIRIFAQLSDRNYNEPVVAEFRNIGEYSFLVRSIALNETATSLHSELLDILMVVKGENQQVNAITFTCGDIEHIPPGGSVDIHLEGIGKVPSVFVQSQQSSVLGTYTWPAVLSRSESTITVSLEVPTLPSTEFSVPVAYFAVTSGDVNGYGFAHSHPYQILGHSDEPQTLDGYRVLRHFHPGHFTGRPVHLVSLQEQITSARETLRPLSLSASPVHILADISTATQTSEGNEEEMPPPSESFAVIGFDRYPYGGPAEESDIIFLTEGEKTQIYAFYPNTTVNDFPVWCSVDEDGLYTGEYIFFSTQKIWLMGSKTDLEQEMSTGDAHRNDLDEIAYDPDDATRAPGDTQPILSPNGMKNSVLFRSVSPLRTLCTPQYATSYLNESLVELGSVDTLQACARVAAGSNLGAVGAVFVVGKSSAQLPMCYAKVDDMSLVNDDLFRIGNDGTTVEMNIAFCPFQCHPVPGKGTSGHHRQIQELVGYTKTIDECAEQVLSLRPKANGITFGNQELPTEGLSISEARWLRLSFYDDDNDRRPSFCAAGPSTMSGSGLPMNFTWISDEVAALPLPTESLGDCWATYSQATSDISSPDGASMTVGWRMCFIAPFTDAEFAGVIPGPVPGPVEDEETGANTGLIVGCAVGGVAALAALGAGGMAWYKMGAAAGGLPATEDVPLDAEEGEDEDDVRAVMEDVRGGSLIDQDFADLGF